MTKVIDIIRETERAGRTRFTFELLPPLKGDGTHAIFDAIETLVPLDPAYINVTFHRENAAQKRRQRPGTVGISAAIGRRFGIETVPHLICGGWGKYDLEDALIDLDFLGMRNVLALRGDRARGEERFQPHPEGFSHASQLVEQIAAMNRGQLLDRATDYRTDFCIGVAGYPEGHAESPSLADDIAHLKRKIDAGAEYIVTQMSFDNGAILDFVRRAREAGIEVPIVVGIKPLAVAAHLEILPKTFAVSIPFELREEVRTCRSTEAIREVGIEWATMQARGLAAAGMPIIHFYSMGRTDNIARIWRGTM